MKVFTVGMDQKPPLEKAPDAPPPSYNIVTPLPMGPELPQPIIVRKSRGYKGILLVMLGVFLMAIFALTLSEMAYNRQRDENFFRLQWAQLRHRFGYPRHSDLGERIVPIEVTGPEALSQKQPDSTTTTEAPVKVFHDKFLVDNEPNSESSSEQQEVREQMARDARLQFLRRILQKIKQNAEDMGLEGTMQVSVVEVEPQQIPEFFANAMANRQQQQQHQQQTGRGRFGPSEDPRSDAFLDSFGEFHAPSPFGVPENSEPHSSPRGRVFGPWQDFEVPPPFFFRPEVQEINFRPPPPPSDWALQRPEVEAFEFRQPETPKSGEIANQEVLGEMYGRKFGRMLQDLIAARLQSHFMNQQHQQQQPMSPLLTQQRPSFPIEQQPQAQQGWWGLEQQAQQSAQPQTQGQAAWAQPQFLPHFQQQTTQAESQISQQAQQAHQQVIQAQQQQEQPQAPRAQQPEDSDSSEAKPPAIQPPRAENHKQEQQVFSGFPQPSQQFPIFVPSEDQRPEVNAWPQTLQAQQAQQQNEFVPPPQGPTGWTHQSEPEARPTPQQPILVDGEVQLPQQQKQEHKEQESQEGSPELIILRKPVDAERIHEDSGPSQLADLPLKELQGELAAAAAALAQQHEAMLEQQQKEDEARQAFLQAKDTDDVATPAPPKVEEKPQQPVEPAVIQAEQPAEERVEQVDFPAVKFPQADAFPTSHVQQDAEPHIFFQVDEPQATFGTGHI